MVMWTVRLVTVALLGCLAPDAFAQSSGIRLSDEGTLQGSVGTIDCDGRRVRSGNGGCAGLAPAL